MEKYMIDILAGVMVLVVGAAVIFIVKASLKSFILDMQLVFMTLSMCGEKHKALAEERESIRKDIQNHESRLNDMGARP
jgi:hypothetical protein